MTAPNEEQDIDVPLRLQPVVARPGGWRGRSINLVAVGLVGFVVLGVVLGTAFDNGAPASSAVVVASVAPSSTPGPTKRPTPTAVPLATPLPTLEFHGTERPTERRLVWGNGQQILDLGSGTMRSFGRQYEDVLWPVGDELVCVCLIRAPGTTTPAPLLRFARFDLNAALIVEHDLVALEGVVPVAEMTEGFNMTAAIDAEANHIVVLDAVRRPPSWVVELHVVDMSTGELLDSTVVDTFPVDLEEPRPSASASASARPGGSAPDGVYAWASTVAVAPDGGSAFVTVARSEVRGDQWTGKNLEWFVPIVDGKAGEPAPLSSGASLATERWCIGRSTFLDDEMVVALCGPPSEPFDETFWSVRRLTLDGRSLGDLSIGAAQSDSASAAATLVDRKRRALYLWDPFRHLLSRVDVDDGRVHEGVVPESMLPGDRGQQSRGWIGVDPGLVISPDGTRLFALGLTWGTSEVGASTGVWVFDADSLELLGRWAPRALLTSLAISADGRFVYAVGAPGYDVDGFPNTRWRASVTVYDARTGGIDVLYGAIGDEGQWLSFQPGY